MNAIKLLLKSICFKNVLFLFLVSSFSFSVTSCKKDDEAESPAPVAIIPTTYNFENVDYAGQTARLAMLEALETAIKKGATGVSVDAQKLKDMYANTNAPFSDNALNTSGKQLKDKTYAPDQALFESYLDSIAVASNSTMVAGNGVAGIATSSSNSSKKYLLSAKGFDYGALFEKSIMGATFYYQAVGHYLTPDEIGAGVDNTTVTPGKGTAMQHHWDEAFGYLGVPVDFPQNTTGVLFYGKYATETDPATGLAHTLMNAFLKGRAAIGANDMTVKDQQAALIIENWEKLVAAAAIHELNEAKGGFADDAVRNHTLSEGIGFVKALKYNPSKKITETKINAIVDSFGDNLYLVDLSDIAAAIDELSNIYGLNAAKASL